LLNGGTQIGGARLTDVDAAWSVVGAADMSGNGMADILWRNNTTGQNIVWVMNGATISQSGFLPTIPASHYSICGIADSNADGIADILWDYSDITRSGFTWLMNGITEPNGFAVYGSGIKISDTNSGSEETRGDFKAELLFKPLGGVIMLPYSIKTIGLIQD
jgi:hypothetical protein